LKIDPNKIERITKQIYLSFPPYLSMNAFDYLNKIEEEEKCFKILDSFDELLGGGLYTRDIIEIQGSSGIGKTNFCLFISYVMTFKYKRKVFYLDTSNSFSSSRILDFLKTNFYQDAFDENLPQNKDICNDYQKKYLEVLSLIETNKIYEIFDLFSILEKIENKLRDEVNNF
jgi:RecA/RadA recombinase